MSNQKEEDMSNEKDGKEEDMSDGKGGNEKASN